MQNQTIVISVNNPTILGRTDRRFFVDIEPKALVLLSPYLNKPNEQYGPCLSSEPEHFLLTTWNGLRRTNIEFMKVYNGIVNSLTIEDASRALPGLPPVGGRPVLTANVISVIVANAKSAGAAEDERKAQEKAEYEAKKEAEEAERKAKKEAEEAEAAEVARKRLEATKILQADLDKLGQEILNLEHARDYWRKKAEAKVEEIRETLLKEIAEEGEFTLPENVDVTYNISRDE